MQKQKKCQNRRLIELYSSYYLNKVSLIIFIIAIVLLTIIFFNASNIGYTEEYYLIEYESIHQSYFSESFFAISIIGSLFAIFLGSLEGASNVNKLDVLIVCNQKRNKVLFYKCISFLLITWLFYIMIFLILFLIPTIIYPKFVFEEKYINFLINLLIWGSYLTLISMFIGMQMQNYFSSLLMFVFFFISKMLSESNDVDIKRIVNAILPQLFLDSKLNANFIFGSFYVVNFIIVIYICLMIFYNKKSLKFL